jgi:hypothetical protein
MRLRKIKEEQWQDRWQFMAIKDIAHKELTLRTAEQLE